MKRNGKDSLGAEDRKLAPLGRFFIAPTVRKMRRHEDGEKNHEVGRRGERKVIKNRQKRKEKMVQFVQKREKKYLCKLYGRKEKSDAEWTERKRNINNNGRNRWRRIQ